MKEFSVELLLAKENKSSRRQRPRLTSKHKIHINSLADELVY